MIWDMKSLSIWFARYWVLNDMNDEWVWVLNDMTVEWVWLLNVDICEKFVILVYWKHFHCCAECSKDFLSDHLSLFWSAWQFLFDELQRSN